MKFIDGFPMPEFVSVDEIKTEKNLTTIALNADYQERLHQFRSNVMLLMMNNNALDPEASWLVYDHVEDTYDGPVLICPRTDICVASRQLEVFKNSKKYFKQHIRVMVNEAFTFEDGTDYLVTDVVIDADDDAQYFIGPMPNRESVSAENVETSLFFVNDGRLLMFSPNSVGMFPPMIAVKDEVGDFGDIDVLPFGHYTNIEDRIHALNVADEIVRSVTKLTPQYTS